MKRIAVVTGGGRGIGRAAAEALSADGWTVVVCGRTADVLEDTAALLAGDSLPVVADVADVADVERLFDTAVEHFGRVDL